MKHVGREVLPLTLRRRSTRRNGSMPRRKSAWRSLLLALLMAVGVSAGCVAPEPRDLSAFHRSSPRSILVLPPINQSPEVDAIYGYLSTVTRPLAEQGYYVFPVMVVDELLRANGLPTPNEMHEVPLAKLAEVTGADAVLYSTVVDYGSQFRIVSSVAKVTVEARLVDARTGDEIWSGRESMQDESGSGQGKLLEMVISAVISQAIGSTSDASRPVARRVNWMMLTSDRMGLPKGPRHPEYVPTR